MMLTWSRVQFTLLMLGAATWTVHYCSATILAGEWLARAPRPRKVPEYPALMKVPTTSPLFVFLWI